MRLGKTLLRYFGELFDPTRAAEKRDPTQHLYRLRIPQRFAPDARKLAAS